MRSNIASDDCSSTDTCSRRPTGKYKRFCSVVKAMMVPAVIPALENEEKPPPDSA